MLKRVLVPLDGSLPAEHVLNVVTELFRATGCAVTLVHVGLPGATLETGYLDSKAATLRARGLREVETATVGGIDVAAALASAAKRVGADLVALTPYHDPQLLDSLRGTVASRIAKAVPTPLLTYHADAEAASALFRRTVIAIDGSALSLRTISTLRSLAGELELKVDLVFVAHPGAGAPESTNHEQTLAEARSLAEASDMAASCVVVSGQDVAATILATARKRDASLVAIATHGRSGIMRLAFGSVADALIRTSPLPVLVVKGT